MYDEWLVCHNMMHSGLGHMYSVRHSSLMPFISCAAVQIEGGLRELSNSSTVLVCIHTCTYTLGRRLTNVYTIMKQLTYKAQLSQKRLLKQGLPHRSQQDLQKGASCIW